MIRVGVIGACGRMGLMVCRALAESDDFALVAAIDRSKIGQRVGQMIGHPEIDVPVSDELDRLLEANAEVAIDFTHPDVAMDDIRWCISHAVHAVVGTTGITQEDLQEVEKKLLLGRGPRIQRDRGGDLRGLCRADAAIRRAGRPVPAGGRDHRAPSRTEGG